MLGGSADLAALQAELESERSQRLALQAELASVREEAEINLQKTSAYWVAKLNEKGIAASPEDALQLAAPASERSEMVPGDKILPADISLTELRSRLLSYAATARAHHEPPYCHPK